MSRSRARPGPRPRPDGAIDALHAPGPGRVDVGEFGGGRAGSAADVLGGHTLRAYGRSLSAVYLAVQGPVHHALPCALGSNRARSWWRRRKPGGRALLYSGALVTIGGMVSGLPLRAWRTSPERGVSPRRPTPPSAIASHPGPCRSMCRCSTKPASLKGSSGAGDRRPGHWATPPRAAQRRPRPLCQARHDGQARAVGQRPHRPASWLGFTPASVS